VPRDIDLAVVGSMARSASDLALELDILAGPDELRDAVAYRLALPPPRHEALKDFRVLVVDTHPLLPTGASVRAALEKLSDRLGKAGVTVARESPLLPDFAEAARLYMRLLLPAFDHDASEIAPLETPRLVSPTTRLISVGAAETPAFAQLSAAPPSGD
jgi:Asp-tRNA(Asn)/Glu-tRNA(Gln) amidotransferase A subunit family amidase